LLSHPWLLPLRACSPDQQSPTGNSHDKGTFGIADI
jgi:hypothetical protein